MSLEVKISLRSNVLAFFTWMARPLMHGFCLEKLKGVIFYLRSKHLLAKYNAIGSKNFIEE